MFGFGKKEEPQTDGDEDLVVKLMKQTGCMDLHHAVQSCIADRRDWRLCQEEVQKFRSCMDAYNAKRKEKLK